MKLQAAIVATLALTAACTAQEPDEHPSRISHADAGEAATSSSTSSSPWQPPTSNTGHWVPGTAGGGGGGGAGGGGGGGGGGWVPGTFSSSRAPGVPHAIQVDPSRPIIPWHGEQELHTAILYTDGTTQPLPSDATWTISAPSVVELTDSTIHGLSAGNATITISAHGLTTTVTVTVLAPRPTGLRITPESLSLPRGTTQRLNAIADLEDGSTLIASSSSIWQSSNPEVADVDITGRLRAVSTGSATISATFLGFDAHVEVTVTDAALHALAIDPPSASIPLGGAVRFSVEGTWSDGTTRDVSEEVAWSTSAPEILDVTAGLATSRSVGRAQVSASLDGITAVAVMTVTSAAVTHFEIVAPSTIPAGSSTPLRAFADYTDGSHRDVTSATQWTVEDPSAAIILNVPGSEGLLTALAPATTAISASFQASAISQPLTVSDATLTAIAITPPSPRIANGTTQQFVATGFYSDGTSLDVTRSVTWSSSNTSIALHEGLAEATQPGSSVVTAALDGIRDATLLTVSNASPTQLRITPASPRIAHGSTRPLAAMVGFSDGTEQDLTRLAAWSSSDGTVASVARGVVTGNAQGNAIISAGWRGISGTIALVVDPPVLAHLAVTPSNLALAAGTSTQLHAQATWSDGSTREVTSEVAWGSSNSGAISVSMGGVASGVGQGSAVISASLGGISASVQARVTEATLVSLDVTGPSVIAAGRVQRLVATGSYSNGTTQDLTAAAGWSSSNPEFLVVQNAGEVRAVSPGDAVLVVTFGTVSKTVIIHVGAPELTSLAITAPTTSLPTGRTTILSAQGLWTDGARTDVTTLVTWASSDTRLARVDATGRVTAISAGTCAITAALQGVVGAVAITVQPASLASIELTAPTTRIAQGTSVQLRAEAIYTNGVRQDVTSSATWSSSAPVVTITRGLARGMSAGTASIAAQFNGVRAELVVTVTDASLAALELVVDSTELPAGYKERITAMGLFSDGTQQDLSLQATWSSSENAFIATPGLVLGVSEGPATITASFAGRTASVELRISNATLSALGITPSTIELDVGGTARLRASGTFSSGAVLDLTTQVTWFSSDSAVVEVGSAGQVTARAEGEADVTAGAGGIRALAAIHVR